MEREQETLESRIELYLCPISLEIMRDPYVTKYGHCYEKKAIFDWISKSSTCPLTKQTLTEDDIFPCYIIKSIIEYDVMAYGLNMMKSLIPVINHGSILVNDDLKPYVHEISGKPLEIFGFSATGSITIENKSDTTVKLIAWSRQSKTQVGEFDLRPSSSQGFDFQGFHCIEIAEGDAALIHVIGFSFKGGGKGNFLGMVPV